MFGEVRKLGTAAQTFLVATFLMGLSNGMFDAVYNFYLEARGIDKTATGHIYAVAMAMMAAAVIPLIVASKRMSQKRLLVISAFVYALPFILLPFLTSVSANAVTLGLILSGMIAQLSLGNALIGANIDSGSRTTIFSYFFVAYLGAAMAGSVAVSVITHYSDIEPIRNYQAILVASFIFALLMVYFRMRSIRGITEPHIDRRRQTGKKSIEWGNFILLFVAASLLGASITLVFRFINIVFNLAYTMNVSEISLIMGGDKIVSIIGALFAPLLVRKIAIKKTVIVVGLLTAACLFFQSLHVPVAIFITLYFMRLLLNYCLMPLLDTLAITGFSKDKTLLSTTLRQFSFYLGSAVSAVVYGDLLAGAHWEDTLIISAGFALAGAIFMSFIRIKHKS
ncbi:MFS transporter [Enterobacter asburiae]|uniref:MFS transporter n=1 Tax=Enterobacter asburiae TaxID=61645 RepID=UPI00192AEBC2|nr:MFS transporter [Enterobacter asburiae]MBL5914251.1 MFS transporter [Enterobacter asburiae]MBL5918547.1 MFS transporter [Enterobacter asburiae]